MRLAKWIAVGSFILSLAATANAATLVVSLNGSDLSLGTALAPLRTLNKAALLAKPGDVIQVRGGVYNELVKITSLGLPTARITFQPAPGEKVVIDGTGTAAATNLVQITGGYVDFVGFEIRNSTRVGLHSNGANNVRLADNYVHSNWRGGILAQGLATTIGTDIVIENNVVTNNCLENQYHNLGAAWGQALGIYRTDRVTVRNNRVYKNHGEGIDFILSDNGVATGNEVFDNFSMNIYLDNAQSMTIDRNLVYNTRDLAFYRDNKPANSIGVANERYETSNPLNDVKITNNILIGGLCGVYYYAENAGGLNNSVIANNTMYSMQWAVIYLHSTVHQNLTVQNNLFYQTPGGVMVPAFTAPVTFRHNGWFGANPGAASGPGDVLGDPRVVNAGGLSADDYKLTHGSPLVEKGYDVAGLDYFGNRRSSGVDIGAHEFSLFHTQLHGGTDTSAPAKPEGARAAGVDSRSLTLTWSAATDDVAVTGYRIFRDGSHVATTAETSWNDMSVEPSTTYHYEIIAVDAAGNQSLGSDIVRVVTLKADPNADTLAPTLPTAIEATAVTSASVTLTWNASRDDAGVTAYVVSRDGVVVGNATETTFTDTTVASGTSYTYRIIALDAAGNQSMPATLQVTTASARRRR